MIHLLRKYTPSFILDLAKRIKRYTKRKQVEAKKDQAITKEQLIHDLERLGLKKGDSVLVHSSLSKIGYITGGADTVLDALLEVVGSEGTLLLPSFPASGKNKDYLDSNPVFDIKRTPSKMGAITETFRKREGVVRSFHPTDPVCAYGKKAVKYTKDHFGQLTPYNQYSPFYKLVEAKGKIVMLGTLLESLTNFHTLEDAVENFSYPVYDEKIYQVKMIDEKGNTTSMQTKVHNPIYSAKRRCNDFEDYFIKDNVMVTGLVGEAKCFLIDAHRLHYWMVDNYQKKGITMYTPQGI